MSSFQLSDFTIRPPTTNNPSAIKALLKLVKALPSPQQRAVAAVVGAAVADAATRPFHWVYDRPTLESVLDTANGRDIAFWPTNVSPFYSLPTGRRSCYNELGYVTLRSLAPFNAESVGKGGFSQSNYIASLTEFFDPETSEYGVALKRRLQKKMEKERIEARAKESGVVDSSAMHSSETKLADYLLNVVEGPWQQAAVTAFLENWLTKGEAKGNPDNKQSDGFCAVLPLVARLACEEARSLPPDDSALAAAAAAPAPAEDSAAIAAAASLLGPRPNSQMHNLAAASVLRALILNGSPSQVAVATLKTAALTGVQFPPPGLDLGEDPLGSLTKELDEVAAALAAKENHSDADERWGKSCNYPGAFQGPFLAVLSASAPAAGVNEQKGFAAAIRKVIKAGGCNCSRANFAGAMLGAVYGFGEENGVEEGLAEEQGIPWSWLLQTDRVEELLKLALERMVVV